MPGKFLQNVHQAFHAGKHFVRHHVHKATKFLKNFDHYQYMGRRILAAAQPLLQDIGIQDVVNTGAMKAMTAYDTAKSDVMNARDRVETNYSRIAAAVGN